MPKGCHADCPCKCHSMKLSDKQKEKIKKNSSWIDHVKEYQKSHNCTFKQALKEAKESYKK